jgi:hypothetical protein
VSSDQLALLGGFAWVIRDLWWPPSARGDAGTPPTDRDPTGAPDDDRRRSRQPRRTGPSTNRVYVAVNSAPPPGPTVDMGIILSSGHGEAAAATVVAAAASLTR